MSSLTKESLMEAAKVRAIAAKRHARSAKADLLAANEELDLALAEGKPAKIVIAREHTRSAEVAVTEVAKDLDIVEGLLDIDNPIAPGKDLLKKLGGKQGE